MRSGKPLTIMDLNRLVGIARESGIFGFYEISLSKYKTALKIIEE